MPEAVEYVGVKIKLCSRCNEFKKVEEFNRNRSKSDGFDGICKKCRRVCYKQWRANNPERRWVINTLNKHRYRGFEVDITIDALTDLAKNTKECPLCGCELDWSVGVKGRTLPNSPTLDRIDNTNTLTLDNVQIICHRCNMAKSTMSMKEFVEYCKLVADRNNYLLEVKD